MSDTDPSEGLAAHERDLACALTAANLPSHFSYRRAADAGYKLAVRRPTPPAPVGDSAYHLAPIADTVNKIHRELGLTPADNPHPCEPTLGSLRDGIWKIAYRVRRLAQTPVPAPAEPEPAAGEPRSLCSYPDCTEESTSQCEACSVPRCREHLHETVAYGLDTTACVGGCSTGPAFPPATTRQR